MIIIINEMGALLQKSHANKMDNLHGMDHVLNKETNYYLQNT